MNSINDDDGTKVDPNEKVTTLMYAGPTLYCPEPRVSQL